MIRFSLAVLLVAAACGGNKSSSPKLPPDPAWVAGYEAAAKDGCTCKDASCLGDVKRKLDAIVTEHGGFDEVPPSVHRAHRDFDKCWRDGTVDPERDLQAAADRLCQCVDASCVRESRISLLQLQDRYAIDATAGPREDLSASQNQALTRLSTCYSAVTFPAANYLALRTRATAQLCECTDVGCVEGVGKVEAKVLKGKLVVLDRASIQNELDTLKGQYCECIGRVMKEAGKEKGFGALPVSVDLDFNCK